MTFVQLIIGLIQPVVMRVLLALGIGYATYNGAQGALIAILENVGSSFGGLPADVIAILSKAGFFLAMSIMSGGLVGGVTYWATRKLSVVSQGNGGSSGG